MRTTGNWGIVTSVAAMLWLADGAVAGGDLEAQNAEPPREAAKVGCLRGKPIPACKSFWIVEMQAHTPLAQTRQSVTLGHGQPGVYTRFGSVLEWNLGHMVNLSPTLAVGGVLTAGTGGGTEPLKGLKLRARRWLSEDTSVEVEGGLLRSGQGYPTDSGLTADVRLNIQDRGSFYLRWDGVEVDPGHRPGVDHFVPGGLQQAFSAGVGLGSVPALIGTGALGLGYVVLIALYLGSTS